jgi:tetratricopeptide (TPR) repeat protein
MRRAAVFARSIALASCMIGMLGVTGCAAKQGEKMIAQVKTVEREETPDKLLARGRAFASVGDHGRAEQYFAAAMERGADPNVALPLLLRACAEEKRYRAAIDYAEPQLRKHPNDHRLRFVVASFYATVGETNAARAELERVAKEAPDFAPAHFALGRLLRDDVGDVVTADVHFREYLRLDPRGSHADEAKSSLLKMVDHGTAITVPPTWHTIASPPKSDPPKRSAP